MPEWVLVGDDQGEPVVLTEWVMETPVLTPIADVRTGTVAPVVFRSRWDARRFVRKRNAAKDLRAIRHDRI